MSVQYLHRMSRLHALCVPADVQQVSRCSTSELRVEPRPDLSATVVLRDDVCDTFTVKKIRNMNCQLS